MKLFQYSVLYHPRKTKKDEDEGKEPQSEILKEITSVMAKDDKEVALRAAREIPEAYLDRLSQIEVAVRPF